MSGRPDCLVVTLGVAALLAFGGCSKRPLPAEAMVDPPDSGQGGQTGTGCSSGDPRLELLGTPLLALDSPPVSGNLYTTLLWTGDEYLFVWRIFNGDSILMQRIDSSGQGVGGNIRLRPFETACDLAWGGGRLAAAWSRGTGDVRDLMFQTFDGLGRPLIDPVTLRSSARIAYDGGVSYGPRIVPIPDGFAIAWSEEEVLVATVDLNGKLRQAPVAAGGGGMSSRRLSVAAATDRILVGWTGLRPRQGPAGLPAQAVLARAFSASLAPLRGAISLDEEATSGDIQLLATDQGFLALWGHGSTPADVRVRVAQIDGDGASAAIGGMAPPVAGAYRDLAPAVWNDDHLVVLWDGRSASEGSLTLSRHAPTGLRQGDAVQLPNVSIASRLYATAHDGIVGFIWSEEVDRGYQVYFQQARSCP